jgi:hypothetical protein
MCGAILLDGDPPCLIHASLFNLLTRKVLEAARSAADREGPALMTAPSEKGGARPASSALAERTLTIRVSFVQDGQD